MPSRIAPALALAAIVFEAGATWTLAQAVALPVERPVEDSRVALDLHDSRVSVVIDPSATPSIHVHDLEDGEDSLGFVVLDGSRGTLRVSQPHGPDEIAPRLLVELVIGSQQRFELRGENVDLTLRGLDLPPFEDEGGAVAAAGRPRIEVKPGRTSSRYTLNIDGGSATVEGIAGLYVTATGSAVDLVETRGEADVALQGGSVRVRGHSGPLLVTGVSSELIIDTRSAAIDAWVDRSVMSVSGDGSLTADGRDSDVIARSWSGPARVEGSGQRVEVSASGTAEETFEARGDDLGFIVSDYAGTIIADLGGGRADIQRVAGKTRVTASRSATVRMEEIQDSVELRLTDGASVEAYGAARELRVRMADSQLFAGRVQTVELSAERSIVRLENVAGRARIRLQDADAELDLRGNRSSPEVSASGASDVRVTMSVPCAVRSPRGAGGDLSDAVEVIGCELMGESEGRAVSRSRSVRPPSFVVLEMQDDAVADVQGVP